MYANIEFAQALRALMHKHQCGTADVLAAIGVQQEIMYSTRKVQRTPEALTAGASAYIRNFEVTSPYVQRAVSAYALAFSALPKARE